MTGQDSLLGTGQVKCWKGCCSLDTDYPTAKHKWLPSCPTTLFVVAAFTSEMCSLIGLALLLTCSSKFISHQHLLLSYNSFRQTAVPLLHLVKSSFFLEVTIASLHNSTQLNSTQPEFPSGNLAIKFLISSTLVALGTIEVLGNLPTFLLCGQGQLFSIYIFYKESAAHDFFFLALEIIFSSWE